MMQLDRNVNQSGKGKYALVLLRQLSNGPYPLTKAMLAQQIKDNPECLDFGNRHSDSEFFVIRLKDKHAAPALLAYADSIEADGDLEFAQQVRVMAIRAENHPSKKKPD